MRASFALARESYELCLSIAILVEVRRVLSYPRLRPYGYSEEEVEEFLRALREAALMVHRWPRIQVIQEDPANDRVLAYALAAKADYIVSKNEPSESSRKTRRFAFFSQWHFDLFKSALFVPGG